MNVSTRSGGIAGIVAGLGYLVQAIMGLIKPQTEVFSGISDYILEVVFIIALVATIFALMGLHSFLKGRYGKAGTIGFWLVLAGTVLMCLSAIATLIAGRNSLGIVFLGGLLLALIGYLVLGITILRAKSLPLPGGLALIFGFPLSVFLNTLGGGIIFGLAWLIVGYLLLKINS
jgi:hypothetical protein